MDIRAETGPMQFGDDWPGVFIRGDNAMWYAMMLGRLDDDRLADIIPSAIDRAQLHGLAELLRSCCVRQPENGEATKRIESPG